MFFVYFIKSEVDQSVYVGLTSNLKQRIDQHNTGKTRSTKSKIPYNLIYAELYQNKTIARKREIEFKKSWKAKQEILNRIDSVLPSNG